MAACAVLRARGALLISALQNVFAVKLVLLLVGYPTKHIEVIANGLPLCRRILRSHRVTKAPGPTPQSRSEARCGIVAV